MHAHFKQLTCNATVFGSTGNEPHIARRIDEIARRELADALAKDIVDALGNDQAVYLVRYIDHRWSARFGIISSNRDFAEKWSKSLVRSIVRTLGNSSDQDNVVGFSSAADMVSAFIINDLDAAEMSEMRRPAKNTEPWWMDSLRQRFAPACVPGSGCFPALVNALEDLPAVLANLADAGRLVTLVAALDDQQCRHIWRQELGTEWPRSVISCRARDSGSIDQALDAERPRTSNADERQSSESEDSDGNLLGYLGVSNKRETLRARNETDSEVSPDTDSVWATNSASGLTATGDTSRSSIPHDLSVGPRTSAFSAIQPPPHGSDPAAISDSSRTATATKSTKGRPSYAVKSALRVPFQAACAIADHLEIWSGQSTAAADFLRIDDEVSLDFDDDASVRTDAASKNSARSYLFESFAASWTGILDWQERDSLTDATSSALLFLTRTGWVSWPTADPRIAFKGRLSDLKVRGFDWLDLSRLSDNLPFLAWPERVETEHRPPVRETLAEDDRPLSGRDRTSGDRSDGPPPHAVSLSGPASTKPSSGEHLLAQRPWRLTPRQRDILSELTKIFSERRTAYDLRETTRFRICIEIYGELLARRSDIADFPVARSLIGIVVEAATERISDEEPEARAALGQAEKNNGVPSRSTGAIAVATEPPVDKNRRSIGPTHESKPEPTSPDSRTFEPMHTERPHEPPRPFGDFSPEMQHVADLLCAKTASPGPASGWAFHPAGEWLPTPNAGLFRLFRGILDSRIYASAKRLGYPPFGGGETPADFLHATAMMLAGESFADPALSLFGSVSPGRDVSETLKRWRSTSEECHAAFQAELLDLAIVQRLISSNDLHVWRLRADDESLMLVAGSSEPAVAVLGSIIKTDIDIAAHIGHLTNRWQRTVGEETGTLYVDEALLPFASEIGSLVVKLANSEHQKARRILDATISSMDMGERIGNAASLTLGAGAALSVLAWGRWLKGLSGSSVPYLLANLLRQPGRVRLLPGKRIEVEIERGPLDVVIEMSGYDDPIDTVPWLDGIGISFATVNGVSK